MGIIQIDKSNIDFNNIYRTEADAKSGQKGVMVSEKYQEYWGDNGSELFFDEETGAVYETAPGASDLTGATKMGYIKKIDMSAAQGLSGLNAASNMATTSNGSSRMASNSNGSTQTGLSGSNSSSYVNKSNNSSYVSNSNASTSTSNSSRYASNSNNSTSISNNSRYASNSNASTSTSNSSRYASNSNTSSMSNGASNNYSRNNASTSYVSYSNGSSTSTANGASYQVANNSTGATQTIDVQNYYSGELHSKKSASESTIATNGVLTDGNQQYSVGGVTSAEDGTLSQTDYYYLVGQVAGESGNTTDDMLGVCSTILNRVESEDNFGTDIKNVLTKGYWPWGRTCDKYLNYDANGIPTGFKTIEQLGPIEYEKLQQVQSVVSDAMNGYRNLDKTTYYYSGNGTYNSFSDTFR